MSLFLGMGKSAASQKPTILSALSVQTSSYGQVIPIVYGQQRIPGKLIWYGDFTPIATTSSTSSGGKGLSAGSSKQTTYTYRAAVAILLCEGQVTALINVWDTKGNLTLLSTTQVFTVPGGGGTFTATPPGSGQYFGDVGVSRADAYSVVANDFGSDGAKTLAGTQATPMVRVASAPAAAGQYQNTGTTSYVFHAGDAGKQVTINYVYSVPDSSSNGQPLQQLSLTLFTGPRPQTPWAYLTSNHPGQDLPYAGLAYVAASQMDLGSSGSLPNFSYEISGRLPFGGAIVDAQPGDIVADLLTNSFYGAGSEDNLILDPAILSFGPSGAYWTPTGPMLKGYGTLYTIGTGVAAVTTYALTPVINVTPGFTYTISCYIDATGVTSGTPGVGIEDITGVTTEYLFVAQTPGVAGVVSGTLVIPVGVTQITIRPRGAGATINNGALLIWSRFSFILGTAVRAQIQIDDYSNFAAYCIANGIFFSPVLDSQSAAGQIIDDLMDIANGAACWSEGLVKLKSYGDTSAVGNGATFTPPTTPIYDLTDTAFISKQGTDPVIITRKARADTVNDIKIEFVNRANSYNIEVAEDKDDANIFLYGLKAADPKQAHPICDATIAKKVANQQRLRAVYIDGGNTYQFTLGWQYVLLEVMDLVTLTDANLGLNKHPVRIIDIQENDQGELDFKCEEFPWGNANPTAYPYIGSSGFAPNQEVDPGNVNTPIIFLAPNRATGGNQPGYEIWMGLSGVNVANWGGCRVWISTDNTTFSEIGRIFGPARMGVLTSIFASGVDPDTTHTLAVDLTESAGVINPGSSTDADQFHTLCYVDGEFIAYSAATLTSAFHYNLVTYIRRGVFNTPIASHAIGSNFVRLSNHSDGSIDEPIFIYQFDPSLLGKTLFFKFTSFNKVQKREQSLANVSSVSFNLPNVSAPTGLTAAADALGVRLAWAEATTTLVPYITYNIYRNTVNNPATATKIASVPSNGSGTQTFYDKSASVDVLYFYWVTAVTAGSGVETAKSTVASSAGLGPGTHSSYRPTTNPLTAHDAGATDTINIAAFNMQIGGLLVAYGSASIIALARDTLYFIYLTDSTFTGGSVAYQAVVTKASAINAYGQLFVGSIKTPKAGASDTIGNGDGGSGAQYGNLFILSPTIWSEDDLTASKKAGVSGWAPLGNQPFGAPSATKSSSFGDGDNTTFGTLAISGPETLWGDNNYYTFISGFPALASAFASITLKIKSAWFSDIAGTGATIDYTFDDLTFGTPTWTNLRTIGAGANTLGSPTIDSVSLPVTNSTGNLKVRIKLLGVTGGNSRVDVYEIWTENLL